jgi:hypothetical protein
MTEHITPLRWSRRAWRPSVSSAALASVIAIALTALASHSLARPGEKFGPTGDTTPLATSTPSPAQNPAPTREAVATSTDPVQVDPGANTTGEQPRVEVLSEPAARIRIVVRQRAALPRTTPDASPVDTFYGGEELDDRVSDEVEEVLRRPSRLVPFPTWRPRRCEPEYRYDACDRVWRRSCWCGSCASCGRWGSWGSWGQREWARAPLWKPLRTDDRCRITPIEPVEPAAGVETHVNDSRIISSRPVRVLPPSAPLPDFAAGDFTPGSTDRADAEPK